LTGLNLDRIEDETTVYLKSEEIFKLTLTPFYCLLKAEKEVFQILPLLKL
jgi:hypothetical protein